MGAKLIIILANFLLGFFALFAGNMATAVICISVGAVLCFTVYLEQEE
jgi:hypothetical protein